MSRQTCLAGCGMTFDELIADGIALLREHEPDTEYYGCFSGGKDSVVIKELARQAGVRVLWHYNVTTIDPPELVRFIRQEHPDVVWDKPRANFFTMMEKRGFPTRRQRWCCEEYKEQKPPKGSEMIVGIRAEESPRRAARWKDVTFHTRSKAWVVAPILRWDTEHVWRFIREQGLPYCRLYDEGFHRLGCIGCPMAREKGKRKEFDRWPRYEKLWRRAFQRIWERRVGTTQRDGRERMGSARWDNWEAMWEWWLTDEPLPKDDECQLDMWS
jgi:phosphoadenosine phosphosulfate reductase